MTPPPLPQKDASFLNKSVQNPQRNVGRKKSLILIMMIFSILMIRLFFFSGIVQVVDINEVGYNNATIIIEDDTELGKNLFNTKSKEISAQPRVKFIPFPHKSIGSGRNVACKWSNMGGNMSSLGYDLIQQAAFNEGMCIPNNVSIHLFSTAEAIECLSPTVQNRNVSIVIAGDSLNRQLFIGLADILLGQPSNLEIKSGDIRKVVLAERSDKLAIAHQNNPSFPKVQFVCTHECYGGRSGRTQAHIPPKIPFSKTCSTCINAFTKNNRDIAAVVGAFVRVLHSQNGSVETTGSEMKSFFKLADNIIFNSMQSLQMKKVPLKYRKNSDYNSYSILYDEFLSYFSNNKNRPFIDYFQLTKSCYMVGCSYDGGHRARYVNRWKAQLLLNTICEVEKTKK